MLSVEQCRTYLKNESYSNAEVEEIRDNLYQLADLLLRQYVSENNEDVKEKTKNRDKNEVL